MSRRLRDLRRLDARTVKWWHEWLAGVQQGCCHFEYAMDDRFVYSVCMGWLDHEIAWKIGRQPPGYGCQCDFEFDFEMPYDVESGAVDDTTTVVGDTPDWKAVATDMKREARRVAEAWVGKEDR